MIWWFRDNGWAVLLALAVAGAFAGIGWFKLSTTDGPPTAELGSVVKFGRYFGKYSGIRPLVIVKTADGLTHQLWTDDWTIKGCRIGDTITVIRRGSAMLVAPNGCRQPKP